MNLREVGQVGLEHFDAVVARRPFDVVRPLRDPAAGHHQHASPAGRKLLGRREAQTGARAGDENRAAIESNVVGQLFGEGLGGEEVFDPCQRRFEGILESSVRHDQSLAEVRVTSSIVVIPSFSLLIADIRSVCMPRRIASALISADDAPLMTNSLSSSENSITS